jgi:D-alanyl-lipoteichoic acid acyltransferase DltB (MBOAT superfamily)
MSQWLLLSVICTLIVVLFGFMFRQQAEEERAWRTFKQTFECQIDAEESRHTAATVYKCNDGSYHVR